MAIVKMNKVNRLHDLLEYATQKSKTDPELISSYECDIRSAYLDFEILQKEYNMNKGIEDEIYARMIIQSFDNRDNITAEQVHQYGKELADEYFKNEHQYIVITHTDSDNLHNHIIFNSVKLNAQEKFNSKTKHTKHDLRRINDKICERYNLLIPEKTKEKGISYGEYFVRATNQSYKGKLETTIDKTIEQSKDYEDFLKRMEKQGYDVRQGKYLSFKNEKAQRFTRTKSLGVDYHESSIKYRIENKDFVPIKHAYIDKNWIDKSDKKFKENYYLKRWASKQNIQYLSKVSTKIFKENMTLQEIQEIEKVNFEIVEKFNEQLEKMDNKIYEFEKYEKSFDTYKNSYDFIKEFKKADNKSQFKKEHYFEFKQYDEAKKKIYILDKKYGIKDKNELIAELSKMKITRSELYATLGKDKEKELEKTRRIQQQRAKEKEQER